MVDFNIKNILKDDRKYLAIVFFIFAIFFLLGFLGPILLDKEKNHWKDIQTEKISQIEEKVNGLFKQKEKELLSTSAEIKHKLTTNLHIASGNYVSLVRILNKDEYEDYSVEVVAPNGKLMAWNDNIAVQPENIFPLPFSTGSAYFYNSELVTYLTVIDTLNLEGDVFYLITSMPFEKMYQFQNTYYRDSRFSQLLSEQFPCKFEISYIPFAEKTSDGRKYSFNIINNQDKKIGLITITKPTINSDVASINNTIDIIQSILLFLSLIFLGFGLKKDYKKITNQIIRICLFSFYLILFRLLLYYIGFPTKLISGPLVDPANFSSSFANGMVKSPVEFLVTAIFFIVFSFNIFLRLYKIINEKEYSFNLIPQVGIHAGLSLLFFLILRGLAASLKSVIFDSSFRYFKDPNILPGSISIVMNINVLLISLSIFLYLFLIILFEIKIIYLSNIKLCNRNTFFVFYIVVSILFVILQKNPLIPVILNILAFLIIYLFTSIVYKKREFSEFYFIYLGLASSLFSISLLNTFNTDLEKENLKTISLNINRPNDFYYSFLLNEVLDDVEENYYIKDFFNKGNTNFNAASFIIWSRSILQKEGIISSISIYNNSFNEIGNFSLLTNSLDSNKSVVNEGGIKEKKIFNPEEVKEGTLFTGITPIYDGKIILGYLKASILAVPLNLNDNQIPVFLENNSNTSNQALDIKEVKIFDIRNGKVQNIFGNIYPSKDQIAPIINAKYNDENENWMILSLNGEKYICYNNKIVDSDNVKIISVLLKEKQYAWSLFNFFKLFILHSIYLIILFIVLFLIKIKKFKYSFRTQLLTAFLIISIIPLILLAIYNRAIVTQRSDDSISAELSERSKYLENYLSYNISQNPNIDLKQMFNSAGKELNISFSVYDGSNQIYNSKEEYFKSGLLNKKLNPEAYYHLYYLSYRDFISKENIDNYAYNAYYKKITLGNENFVIGVSDAFNKVLIPISAADVDVFLFGIYSLASIIIIIISTILANRISKPIRTLTKATASVAKGDLNIQLQNVEKGEVKELFESFNSMTKELKKNEAQLSHLERENAWKEMARQVAHEIKNPLTPMKLAIQQLMISYKDKNKNFDSIFEKVSATILNQIDTLNQIATEFSSFARMPNFKLEVIDLLPVIHDTLNLFTEEKIKFELKTELKNIIAEADVDQVRRLLINLIRNSIQAKATNIIIEIIVKEGYYNILISDNGLGIRDDIQDKIFEHNFTTKKSGMGLGLKLSKRFLEGINGDIILASSNNNGTTFNILIPEKK